MITLTLPYPISANRYWQTVYIGKGDQRRAIMVPTKEAKAYKEEVGWIARKAGVRSPIDWRFVLELKLYPALPQDWAKRKRADPYWDDDVRCMDLGNCEKVLSDALQGVIFTDDKWVWREVKDRMAPDHLGARVEVCITPLDRLAPPPPQQVPLLPPVAAPAPTPDQWSL